jgi:SAM-dependent methyltransferase
VIIEDAALANPDRRAEILQNLATDQLRGLEIGPLHSPIVEKQGGEVYYVDYLDGEGLRAKYAADPNVDVSQIVDVDALWGESTLYEATTAIGPFDYVVASHVIEHVPDLVTWLDEVADVLVPEGQLRLAIPDRRYSFDYYRDVSALADVLTAHIERPRVPRIREVLDFALNHVDVPLEAAWSGIYPGPRTYSRDDWSSACAVARELDEMGVYRDVHCWVFTPSHFVRLMMSLAQMGLLRLKCDWVTETRVGAIEFFACLSKAVGADEVLPSWQKAASLLGQADSVTAVHSAIHRDEAEYQLRDGARLIEIEAQGIMIRVRSL